MATPNDRLFFEKLFMAILFTLRVFARNLLRGNRIFILCIFFVFCFDVRPGTRTLAFKSNKPTHYLLDYGDFFVVECSFAFSRNLQRLHCCLCILSAFFVVAFSFNCILLFLLYWCCWFTYNKVDVFICIAFVNHFNVK